VASAAVRAAYSHKASASPGVSGGSGRAGRVHRCWSFGQLKSAASLPPPYQTGSPFLAVSLGSATAYPVTWPGLVTLWRSRASTPAWSRRAKNSCSLLAEAAAVETWRRRVVRGGSAPPVAGGFAGLGAGGAAGRGAVGRGGGPQPVPLLGGNAGIADPVPLVHHAGAGPVLAGQHRDQMDVVRPMPDRDPPHRVVFFPAWAQTGTVHHVLGYLCPFAVGKQAVLGGGAHRAVPDRLGILPLAEHVVREAEQAGQAAEVPAAAGAQRGFQVGRGTVAGDDVRVGVFLPSSGAVQVADQPGYVLAARADLPDHQLTYPRSRPGLAECHPLRSGPHGTPSVPVPHVRNAVRTCAGWCGTPWCHSGSAG
jgi:hypothetical protein